MGPDLHASARGIGISTASIKSKWRGQGVGWSEAWGTNQGWSLGKMGHTSLRLPCSACPGRCSGVRDRWWTVQEAHLGRLRYRARGNARDSSRRKDSGDELHLLLRRRPGRGDGGWVGGQASAAQVGAYGVSIGEGGELLKQFMGGETTM